MSKEPAAIIGGITALVSALLVFAKAFGLDLTNDQQEAIRGLVAVIAPIVASVVIRSFVVSPNTTSQKIAEAHANGQAGKPAPTVPVRMIGHAAQSPASL